MTTVVIIPPLGGTAAMLGELVADLERDCDVVVHEALVRDGAPSTRAMAAAAWADVSMRVHGPALLFGVSLGGMIAQWLALDHPQAWSSLVLASTTARGLDAVPSPSESLALARCLFAPAPMRALVDEVTERAAGPVVERELAAHPDSPSRAEILALVAAAAAHDARAELSALVLPVVVVTGRDDAIIDGATQAELARLTRARHVVLAAGHDVTLDAPHETAAVLRSAERHE
jgi:pimeloyl-ACP methyl ester carboxylesterase